MSLRSKIEYRPQALRKATNTDNNPKHKAMNYDNWENALKDIISERIGATRSDAQGIISAQSFHVANEWNKGSTPPEAVRNIAEKCNWIIED